MRIGAPLKLLTKLKPASAETTLAERRWRAQPDAGGARALASRGAPAASDDAGLAALYAQLTAEASGRKITYKALKAGDFFVVAGEEGGDKFYTRFARAPADWPQGPTLRGFTFVYPASKAGEFDKLSLAIANCLRSFRRHAREPWRCGDARAARPFHSRRRSRRDRRAGARASGAGTPPFAWRPPTPTPIPAPRR